MIKREDLIRLSITNSLVYRNEDSELVIFSDLNPNPFCKMIDYYDFKIVTNFPALYDDDRSLEYITIKQIKTGQTFTIRPGEGFLYDSENKKFSVVNEFKSRPLNEINSLKIKKGDYAFCFDHDLYEACDGISFIIGKVTAVKNDTVTIEFIFYDENMFAQQETIVKNLNLVAKVTKSEALLLRSFINKTEALVDIHTDLISEKEQRNECNK